MAFYLEKSLLETKLSV